tara:strand:- start:9 stop:1019 length:1011 start_codon:yes stop_codon:yes gene_type:complete
MEEENPLGLNYTPTISDAFEGAVNYLGGVARFYKKTVPEFFTNVRRSIKEESETPAPVTDTINPFTLGEELVQGMSKIESQVLEPVAQFAENLGASEALAGGIALGVGMVLPGPDFSRGSASYQRLIKRSQEIEKLGLKVQEYRAIGKTARASKNEAKRSSAQSNVLPFTPENPKAYPQNVTAAKEMVAAEKAKRGTIDTLHLHHKLPKGMSAAFFDRMDHFISRNEASYEDLLEMADDATKIGLRTGDAKSNLLAIADKPHTTLHTEMRAMDSGMFGKMELGKKELMAAMREAKDPKSLKALWKSWINDDAKYLVETAEVWEPLDNLLKEIRKSP